MAVGRLGKRNGIRNRLRLNESRVCTGAPVTQGFKQLCRKYYGLGRLRAREIGDLAHASDPSSRLAKAKGRGTNPKRQSKHSARSVRRTLEPDCKLYEPYTAKVACWDKRRVGKVDRDVAFLPPHETLDALARDHGAETFTTFTEGQGEFKATLQELFAGLALTLGTLCAAIGLWGDGAPTVKRDGIYLLLFTVLSGACRQRFWITCFRRSRICKCGCGGKCAFETVYNVVTWSMRALPLRQ